MDRPGAAIPHWTAERLRAGGATRGSGADGESQGDALPTSGAVLAWRVDEIPGVTMLLDVQLGPEQATHECSESHPYGPTDSSDRCSQPTTGQSVAVTQFRALLPGQGCP